jgi:hypothetical protein
VGGETSCLDRDDPQGDTIMFTKLALLTTVIAILAGSASASFAAPKQVSEPLYFTYATGEQG